MTDETEFGTESRPFRVGRFDLAHLFLLMRVILIERTAAIMPSLKSGEDQIHKTLQ